MDDDLLLDQFARLLDALPADEPWETLSRSGYLDLLAPAARGGADLPLEALFPLALEIGRRPDPPPILETMAARMIEPDAVNCSDVEAVVPNGRPLAAVLAAAQMAGAMAHIQQMTVDYALQRRQFGREIGKFQAVQHQIAVLAQETMAARMAAQSACAGSPLAVSAHLAGVAKLRAGQAAVAVCAIAHAVHGAIGVSEEHSLRLYTRRLHILRMRHGGEGWWAMRLGERAFAEAADVATLVRAV